MIIIFPFFFGLQKGLSSEPTNLLLGVQQAEAIGIENSPEIKLVSSQRSIKELLVKESWRTYFPTASVSWFRNGNTTENEADARSQRLALNLDQVVFDGGRRSLALQVALSDLNLSKYELTIAINQLKFKIRSGFYKILSSKAQIDILDKSIERQADQLKFAKKEQSLGDSTELAVLQIENRLNEITLQRNNAAIAYRNEMEEFKILLRLPSDCKLSLEGDILEGIVYSYKDLPEEDLIRIALSSRVEIDRAKAKEIQTASEKEIAESYYIPTFSVGGFYAGSGDRYDPRQREYGLNFKVNMLFGPNSIQDTSNYISRYDDTNRSLTSSTTANIYDQLQYKRNLVQTAIAHTQAKVTRRQLDDILKIEVIKSHSTLTSSYENMKLADENVKIFDKRLSIKILQTKLGDARRIDLAETEIFFLQAKTAQVTARVQYMTSIAQLELSLGANLDSLKLWEIK
ncbi:TolC family protein [Leptospira sp. 'Mane']|uniref:TolC family protein n=1 Tax=Leptospira sp. 'Mane' TaxID=3387407 RepID=UPI00398AF8C8